MSGTVKVALAGIAGYGDAYLEALLPKQESLGATLVGVVDLLPQRCKRLHELQQQNIPVHSTLRGLFADTAVDLMLIVTPIHLHAAQTAFALQHGANVLCEKPLAGTLRDAVHMAEVQAVSKQFTAIGFQWSFSQAVQSLKRDIAAGVLGRPIRMKALVSWPRPISYFRRNDWAGRIATDDGQGVFDSPVNNAAAHFLHNMLYLLGPSRETSAMPATVQAELYRANDIQNYDTAAVRCVTEGDGVELLFFTSHAVSERRGPRSSFEFEHATVEYDAGDLMVGGAGAGGSRAEFVARFKDGRVKYYGHPNLDRHEKIWQSIESVRTGKPIACGIAAAMPHAICVAAAADSAGSIADFPPRLRRLIRIDGNGNGVAAGDGDTMVAIDRLGEHMAECYEQAVLPSEHPGDLLWARPGAIIDLRKQLPPHPQRDAESRRPASATSAAPAKVSVTVHAARAASHVASLAAAAAAAAPAITPWPSAELL